MAVQAKGRMTFHKIIDGKTLNFMLKTNISPQQIKSKDPVSYLPDYTKTPLVLTPVLSVSGNGGTNMVKGACTWYADGVKITSGQNGYTIGTGAGGDYSLKLAANPTAATRLISCEYTYTDADSGAAQLCTTSVTLTQVENAGTTIIAQLEQPVSVFTTTAGKTENIRIRGNMVRGGEIDSTMVSYAWEIQGADGNFYKITSAGAPAGSNINGASLFSGWTTATLVVNSNAVLNISNIRLTITDTDPSSSTYNKTCSTIGTIIDMTDPYTFTFDQSRGSSISKNSTDGKPVVLGIMQGGKAWADADYNNKTLGFYRLTAAGAKDSTWTPPTGDFPGWTIANNEVKRTFSATAVGTEANRTVAIKFGHMLTGAETTFEGYIDF